MRREAEARGSPLTRPGSAAPAAATMATQLEARAPPFAHPNCESRASMPSSRPSPACPTPAPSRHLRRDFRPHPLRPPAARRRAGRPARAGAGAHHPRARPAASGHAQSDERAPAGDGAARLLGQSPLSRGRPRMPQRGRRAIRWTRCSSCARSWATRARSALLMGVDAYLALTTWSRWEQLFELAHVVIAHRPGFELDTGELPRHWPSRPRRACQRDPSLLRLRPAGGVLAVDIPPLDISGTAIRVALREGRQRPLFASGLRSRLYWLQPSLQGSRCSLKS